MSAGIDIKGIVTPSAARETRTPREEPGRVAQRSFEEIMRRSRTKRTGGANETDEPDAIALDPLAGSRGGAGRFAPLADGGAAGRVRAEAIAQPAPAPSVTAAPDASAVEQPTPLAQDWSGRIVTGPWAGLELQVAIHGGVATVQLRPASRQQFERLDKARATLAASSIEPTTSGEGTPFPLRMELIDDDRLD